MTKTDCGVKAPLEELENVVQLAIDCLRAQLVSPEEQQSLDKGVQEALQVVSRVVRTSIIGTSINRTTDYPNYYTNVYLDAGHTLGIGTYLERKHGVLVWTTDNMSVVWTMGSALPIANTNRE